MLDHIAELIGLRAVPTILVPARLEDENISLAHFNHTFNHFRGVDAGIADQVRNVGDNPGASPVLKGHLANGAASGPEVNFAVHMGSQVDTGLANRPVSAHAEILAAHPFMIGHGQRLVVGPLGSLNTKREAQVEHLGRSHELKEFTLIHALGRLMGHHPGPGRFDFYERDRLDHNPGPLIVKLVNLADDGFGQQKMGFGHGQVGQCVIFIWGEHLIPALAMHFL